MPKYKEYKNLIKVDQQDQHLLDRHSWSITGECRNSLRRCIDRTYTVSLANVIMNPPHDLIVDHINGDFLDNRRCNLRVVTVNANRQNRVSFVLHRTSRFLRELNKTRHLNPHLSDEQYYTSVSTLPHPTTSSVVQDSV